MAIVLRKADLDILVQHCRDSYQAEACGILIGTKGDDIKNVTIVFPTDNILNSETEYQINPQEQLDAFIKADELSLEVVGYYHSHPYWQAQPSGTDKSRANQSNCSYIIYSNMDEEVRSFHWDGLEFRAEELITSES